MRETSESPVPANVRMLRPLPPEVRFARWRALWRILLSRTNDTKEGEDDANHGTQGCG